MEVWVALLRGINVGGRNTLPMAELRALAGTLGCRHAKTYVQSGNLVFQAEAEDGGGLADRMAAAIEKAKGFRPAVLLLSQKRLLRAMTENPFPEAVREPKTLHLFWPLSAPEGPNLSALEKVRADAERYELKEGVLYLWCPNGLGRSKLAAGAERALGVEATARNWRTVEKLRDLAAEVARAP